MLQRLGRFASKTFLLWMLLASITGFLIPDIFKGFGTFVPYLLGIVMLGMGLTVTVDDFKLILEGTESCLNWDRFTIYDYAAFCICGCEVISITS